MTGSYVTHLACSRCETRHEAGVLQNVCRACGAPLVVLYDLEAAGAALRPADLAGRPRTMWRWRELLPLPLEEEPVTLGEGGTALLPLPRLGREIGLPGLLLKDDGANPTGSFKARGAACGVSMARWLGISDVALPTAGNAGGAWAAYGAAAGLGVHVAMPADAPLPSQLEVRLHGAELTLVDGLISDAGRLIGEEARRHGWFDAATLREPYRIEGKKTLGLEIAEDLGFRTPDVIVYPAGGGVGLIGIHRAFEQLRRLRRLEGDPPRLVIVQAEGCAPLVRAFDAGAETAEPWEGARTLAAGLRVPKALGDALVLRALRATSGTALAVSDDAMLDWMARLARHGLLVAPEGAATLAGAAALREGGWLSERDRVVVVNTGSGLKYPEAVALANGR